MSQEILRLNSLEIIEWQVSWRFNEGSGEDLKMERVGKDIKIMPVTSDLRESQRAFQASKISIFFKPNSVSKRNLFHVKISIIIVSLRYQMSLGYLYSDLYKTFLCLGTKIFA